MINNSEKFCQCPDGCTKRATFNISGEKVPKFCKKHKTPEMVDVCNDKCIKCTKKASCNYENEKKPLYCGKHRLTNMINIITKRCLKCTAIPSYNKPGLKTALYCFKHKENDMVDVKSKKCIENGCTKQPSYNLKDEKQALYCRVHQKTNMINVKYKKCKSEWCDSCVNPRYDGYCAYCYANLYPDNTKTKNYKTKEKEVVNYIKSKFPEYTWIADKRINNGCSKRRPDLLVDFGFQVLIIEIDENQHIDYDCSCENKRLMEISQDVSHRPIVFIRFNPDAYYDNSNNLIKSCWTFSKGQNSISVPRNKKKEWATRLNILEEQIKYWCENKTEKTVETIQLYYDCNL